MSNHILKISIKIKKNNLITKANMVKYSEYSVYTGAKNVITLSVIVLFLSLYISCIHAYLLFMLYGVYYYTFTF